MGKKQDLYSILEVPKDAEPADIKKAYRKKAKDLHPDTAPNADPSLMRDLSLAYSVLSDDAKRKHYDETGDVEKDDEEARITQEAVTELLHIFFDRCMKQDASYVVAVKERAAVLAGKALDLRANVERTRDMLTSAKGKILESPENDYIGNAIADYLRACEDDEKKALRLERISNRLEEIAKGYKIAETAPKMSAYSAYFGPMYIATGTNL